MKRTINFVINGTRCEVTVETRPIEREGRTIDLQPVESGMLELSITGECDGSAGQCVDEIRELGAGMPDVQRLCDIWDRWHLNNMKAGTRRQMEIVNELPKRDYEVTRAALKDAGLETDNGYSYGSAWLTEPLPSVVLDELEDILDRLRSKRLGAAPDVSDAPDVGGDIIDSRDVIKRLESFRDAVVSFGIPTDITKEQFDKDYNEDSFEDYGEVEELVEEYIALRELDEECSDSVGDWTFGATLIADSYFTDYAEQLAEDIGAIQRDAHWPNDCIDWEKAADELKMDYTQVEFKGDTYWVR